VIIFQVRVGYFGQYGWRKVPFWSTWLPAWLMERVTRIVIGSSDSIGEMSVDGYHWFDKRVRRDRVHELTGLDTSLNLQSREAKGGSK
jgi:hypothetical protein